MAGYSTLTAREIKEANQTLLGVKLGSPLLTMERTAFDDAGRAVEYAQHCYRADSYFFDTTLVCR